MRVNHSRRHLANFISVIFVYALSLLAPFLVLILVGRQYPPAGFGRYTIATSFAGAFAILFNLGVSNTLSFEIAAREKEGVRGTARILNQGLAVFALFSVVGLLATGIALILLPYSRELQRIILCIVPGYWFLGLTTVFNGVFLGIRRMPLLLVPATLALLCIVLLVVPLAFLRKPLWMVAGAWSLSQGAGTLTVLLMLRRRGYLRRTGIQSAAVRYFLRRSLGVGLDNLVNRLANNMTSILLPLYLSAGTIGVFNGALKPYILFVAGTQISIQFFNPYIASVRHGGKRKVEGMLSLFHRAIFLTTCSITILPLFFAEPLNRLFFGERLLQSIPLMTLLAIGFMVGNFPPYSSPLKALGMEWRAMLSSSARLLVNLAGILVLVPLMGIRGAVYAMIASLITFWLVNIFLYAREGLRPVTQWTRYPAFLFFSLLNGIVMRKLLGNGMAAIILFLFLEAGAAGWFYLKGERGLLWRLLRGTPPVPGEVNGSQS